MAFCGVLDGQPAIRVVNGLKTVLSGGGEMSGETLVVIIALVPAVVLWLIISSTIFKELTDPKMVEGRRKAKEAREAKEASKPVAVKRKERGKLIVVWAVILFLVALAWCRQWKMSQTREGRDLLEQEQIQMDKWPPR
jgi:hypothetical protein